MPPITSHRQIPSSMVKGRSIIAGDLYLWILRASVEQYNAVICLFFLIFYICVLEIKGQRGMHLGQVLLILCGLSR